jgi:large subunit ribosomal protein L22
VISPAFAASFSTRAAFTATPKSLFSTAATAPATNPPPPVPISESTQPESKLELDAFGEPRVMAWLPKVKTSPRKLNLVAKLVRRMGLEQALMQLQFCSKKMADVVAKTIHDAKWNAVNNNVSAA